MSVAEKLTTIAENTQKIYEAGKKAEYDKFWDQLQNGGKPMSYHWLFSYNRFSDETYNPKYDIVCANTANAAQNIFYDAGITDTKVTIYANGSANNCSGMFYWNDKIKTVRKLVVAENVRFVSFATDAIALENIAFEGTIGQSIDFQHSPLTKESITNVIEHLSSAATNQTATFKRTAKEAAFTAEEWETLIATKPNWTITLV